MVWKCSQNCASQWEDMCSSIETADKEILLVIIVNGPASQANPKLREES